MMKLRIEDEEGNETLFPMQGEITIGRADGNTIQLTERNVSRQHARIFEHNGQFMIEPMSARYGLRRIDGTVVDGPEPISPGSAFLVGDFRVSAQAPPSASRPVPSVPAQTGPLRPPRDLLSGPSPRAEGTAVMPAAPAKLVIVSSNFAGQEFPLARQQMIIGRAEDSDIIIDHRSVSSHHAKLVRDANGAYQIVDLESKNGLRIGGEKYTNVYLKRGDIVELGHVKFRFVEPGENYVFTPLAASPTGAQAAIPAVRPSSSGSANTTVYAAIGAVALAAVVAVGWFVTQSNKKPVQPLDPPATTAGTTAGTSGGDGVSEQIKKGLARATEEIERGDIEKAIGLLEALQLANPSGKERDKIAELLSRARQERPFKEFYVAARTDVRDQDFSGALRNIKKIPDHSIFARLVTKEQVRETALKGAMEDAKKAVDERDYDEAEKILGEVLLADREHAGALAMQKEIKEATTAVAVRTTPRPRPNTTAPRPKPTPPKPRPKTNDPDEAPKARTKLTEAEARAKLDQAMGHVISGNSKAAISECTYMLRLGYKECHRTLGMAYRGSDNAKACASFKSYLSTKPKDAVAIRNQMNIIGCN